MYEAEKSTLCFIFNENEFTMYTYILYCTGVWFVGELLSETYGIVSAHGLIVANTFIPGSMTYYHGCFMVSL